MNRYYLICVLALTITCCDAQNKKQKPVGGPCEGCEAIHEYADKNLTAIDTLPLFRENEPKMKLSGIVYHKDGVTPAPDVIIYVYQTNRKGIYQKNGDEKGWAKRHGFIRGWLKTNSKGEYTFYTFRPGAYPGQSIPEHIHVTIKEPGKNAYFVDDFMFEDDPYLTKNMRNNRRDRAGSGIVMPKASGSMLEVSRDFVLGLNIPDYD